MRWSTELTEIYRGARILGGGSVLNDMMHQRTPREAFDWVDPDTMRRAWPREVDRGALDPHYRELEELLGVRHLSWADISMIGGSFARMFAEAGLSCDRGRFNFGWCGRCGFCEAGCDVPSAKITLVHKVLPELEATGNAEIHELTTALRITRTAGGYAVEVEPEGRFEAPKVICAAGPLGTVPLLLRSERALGGLPATLGRWISNTCPEITRTAAPRPLERRRGDRPRTRCGHRGPGSSAGRAGVPSRCPGSAA